MSTYLSENGRKALAQKLLEAEDMHRVICANKADAYENSGDGWHDNPAYNKLLSDEQASEKRIQELRETLATATIFSPPAKRNTKEVQLGSIVKVNQYDTSTDEEKTVIWEIVPVGDTDISQARIAYNAPLVAPLLGLVPGETTNVTTGKKELECEIIKLFSTREEAGI